MKRVSLLLFFLTFTISITAQNKKLWAKSFLNKKAPKLVVEDWITEKPETKGKYVLIDFWATWCGPCKVAIPKLNKFAKKFKDHLVVIGISDESKKETESLTSPKIEYFSAYDTKQKLKKTYQVKGIPHIVVINPEGVVIWEGYPFLTGYELTEKVVADLLKK